MTCDNDICTEPCAPAYCDACEFTHCDDNVSVGILDIDPDATVTIIDPETGEQWEGDAWGAIERAWDVFGGARLLGARDLLVYVGTDSAHAYTLRITDHSSILTPAIWN